MNNTLNTISEIEYICNYLVKISEYENNFILYLNIDKIGLELTYNEICFIIQKFYKKIEFCSYLKGLKSMKLQNHCIIFEKY